LFVLFWVNHVPCSVYVRIVTGALRIFLDDVKVPRRFRIWCFSVDRSSLDVVAQLISGIDLWEWGRGWTQVLVCHHVIISREPPTAQPLPSPPMSMIPAVTHWCILRGVRITYTQLWHLPSHWKWGILNAKILSPQQF